MGELGHTYTMIIQAEPPEVWEALTRAEIVRRYYFGFDLTGKIEAGGSYALSNPKHGSQIEGEILEVVPPTRLVQTFCFVNGDDAPSRVTWEIEPWGKTGTVLTLVHDDFDGETDTYKSVDGGWPAILSGLKTWLETGKELRYVPTEGEAQG
jgi:uncharacterized protein YndB with AHSA1/START domain